MILKLRFSSLKEQIHFFPSSPQLIFEREKKWFYQIKHTVEQNMLLISPVGLPIWFCKTF